MKFKQYTTILIQNVTVPYPAGLGTECCATVRWSSDVCVWHISDRPPGWWKSLPYRWEKWADHHVPQEGNADQYPAGSGDMVWGPFSLNVRTALQVEWADMSPSEEKKKTGISQSNKTVAQLFRINFMNPVTLRSFTAIEWKQKVNFALWAHTITFVLSIMYSYFLYWPE